jgi:Right handed beta helix region
VKVFLATTAAIAALSALPAPALAADGCDRVASPGSDTAQQLLDSLRPGETGCLHGGTYVSSWHYVLNARRGGEPGAPITLRSYPGERARLVGIIDIRDGSDYITLSGLDIEGTADDGANTIKVYSRGVVLEKSDITNVWRGRSCLILGNNEGGGQAVAPIVRANTFHECGNPANGNHDHGVYAANVLDGEIVDNLFYNSAAYTIQLYPNARRTRFAHNVVDGSRSVRGGIVFGGDGRFASSDNVVERNVIVNAATAAITSYWEGPVGTDNVARENCVWGSGYGDDITREWGFTAVSNRVARPLFASRSARDYRLAPGSQCLRTVGYDTVARRAGHRRMVARRPHVSSRRLRTKRVRAKWRVLVKPLLRSGLDRTDR